MSLLEKFSAEFVKRHDFEDPDLDIFLNRWKNKAKFHNIPVAWILPLDTMMFELNKLDIIVRDVRQEFGQLCVGIHTGDYIKSMDILKKAKSQIKNIDKDLYSIFDIVEVHKEISKAYSKLYFSEKAD